MTDNPRQDLEREAREASERWYPPGAGRLGGKLYAGKPAKEGFRERSSFQHGYIAAATAREKEVAELRAEVNDWRESARKASGERCEDEIHCCCVPYLRVEIASLRANLDRARKAIDAYEKDEQALMDEATSLRAKLAVVPVEEIALYHGNSLVQPMEPKAVPVVEAWRSVRRWLATVTK